MAATPPPLDCSARWDFNQPVESEARFRDWLGQIVEPDHRLQIQTQIARAQGLQQKFEEAHETLRGVEHSLPAASPAARVRYFLERGRVFNSSRQPAQARPLFLRAFEEAQSAGLDGLAVDALHMMAIVDPPEAALEWNKQAVALAEKSPDPAAQQWLGALLNNLGWTHFERKEFAAALDYFERDEQWYAARQRPAQARLARYAIGKTKRMLGHGPEALALQLALAGEFEALQLEADGFVFEEIAECQLALENHAEAKIYFRKAHALLSQDSWLARDEPARLARLKSLAGS